MAGLEIERKYLIRMPDTALLDAYPGREIWEIRQDYLTSPAGVTDRVRRVSQNGHLRYYRTTKIRLNALSAKESEKEIDRSLYEKLLLKRDASLRPIEKTRYRLPYGGQTAEIDIYPFWSDRAVLEIELENEEEACRIPPFIDVLREVTADFRYKNVRLASEIPYEEL